MDIERILKEKHITKVLLAERMGIKQQNVNAVLKNPTMSTLDKIAYAVGMKTWEIMKEISGEIEELDQNIVICPNCGTRLKVTRDDKQSM